MRFLIAVALAVLCFSTLALAQTLRTQRMEYENWISMDVAYIINAEEAARYRSLTTNADRNRFIIEFWLRRDPTPGTAENEYKEEHYRRIAYANEHFAEKAPGWQSARGRTYIVEGPPDHVVHRQLTTGEQAEDWVWDGSTQNRNVLLFQKFARRDARRATFIDFCKCGRYERQPNVTDK